MPIGSEGNGHGCGHNLLGTGSFAAAVAIKDYMEEKGLAGTVRYFGCPAEENGSGKAYMARAGFFDDVDVVFLWHPKTIPGLMNVTSLANYSAVFKFYGKSAHAAAALMTETKLEVDFVGTAADLIPNNTLARVMHRHLTAIGLPEYDANDEEFARKIQATLSEEDIATDLAGLAPETVEQLKGKAIADIIPPYREEGVLSGSTDVGDVSWNVPTMQCITGCWAIGAPFHTWQVVSQGTMPIAHKGMLQAGKVIAATAIDVMENEEMITQAKAEWRKRLNGEQYVSLIPEAAEPPKK